MASTNNRRGHFLSILLGSSLFLSNINMVSSHGRMLDPPQRSSLWRYGFPGVETNHEDNELFCGGFQVQWDVNGGKCGVCGDPYQGPFLHMAGNKYGKGIIGKVYNEGQSIKVKIDLTANHKGYFEYRLCVHDNPVVPITEECFNDHLLYIEESADTRYPIGEEVGNTLVTMTVQLPTGVTCTQCVLRWKYYTGNSWGCDGDGTCALGKGKQEQFQNCADIAIMDNGPASTKATTVASRPTLSGPSNAGSAETKPSPPPTGANVTPITSTIKNDIGLTTMSVTDCARGHRECVAKYPYAGDSMVRWCNYHCNYYVKFCPKTHCRCKCRM